ncbi:MAG: proton-conducting transporter membrane subunit, partial [bacterium]
KMVLAFSTMSQVGFIIVGLKSGGLGYAGAHTLYKSLLFLSVGYFYHIYQSKDCKGERKQVPITLFIAFLVGFLSFSGIPFFIGSSFKQEIIKNSCSIVSLSLKFISIISIFALCKILFLLKPTKKLFLLPYYDFGIILLAAISMIVGSVNTLALFSIKDFIEGIIILFISILFYFFLSKRLILYYPYKIFKLSSALAIFSIIIAIIMSLSLIGLPII